MATILVLSDFRDMDTREQEVLVLIGSDEDKIIVDASELTVYPAAEDFENILFFSRLARDSARRRGHQAPKIIFVVPKTNTRTAMERVRKLIDKGGFDIELAASLNDAKVAFEGASDWRVLKASPEVSRLENREENTET